MIEFSVVFEIGTFRTHRISVSQWTACLAVLTWETVMWYSLHRF